MDPLLLAAIGLGFLLGVEHALDADHVVAVSTIVSRSRNLFRAALMGAVWGLGHTTTLFIVGGIIMVVLRVAIPDSVALSLEFLVGIMLVVLGLTVLRTWFMDRRHTHGHAHEAAPAAPDPVATTEHVHSHAHHVGVEHEHAHGLRRPFFIGIVHGMAGSAALFLLALSEIDSTVGALVYILVFGMGSVAGMLLVTTAISLPFVISAQRFQSLNGVIRLASGTLSILLGIMVMYQIGFVEGLFTGA